MDWSWENIWGLPASHGVLVWERVDSETVLDLTTIANNPLVLAQIDAFLGSDATRRGAVTSSYMPWSKVPSGIRNAEPGLHADSDLLLTINLDYHVSTPWYCSDVTGTIVFYMFPSLSSTGVLSVSVDGASATVNGGLICHDTVKNKIHDALGPAIDSLQGLIDAEVSLFGGPFSMIYILPGHGGFGSSSDDADKNASLAAIPIERR